MTRTLTDADKTILAVQHAGAVLKAVLDLKRFQREHNAYDILLTTRELFTPAQGALIVQLLRTPDL